MSLFYLAIAFGLAVVIKNLFYDPELKNVEPENIYKDFLFQHYKKTQLKNTKQKITKVLNSVIIPEFKYFKIGKTGNPNRRAKEHKVNFDKVFLLCKSKYPEHIVELEKYYIEKYYDHSNNKNKIKGSTGANVRQADDFYYLYVAVK
jgi:hypothetical protein